MAAMLAQPQSFDEIGGSESEKSLAGDRAEPEPESSELERPKRKPGRPKTSGDPEEVSEGGCRPTFYMSTELLNAIEAQCEAEGDKKRSPFLADILHLILLSPIGQQLRQQAHTSRQDLVHELQNNLILFHPDVPTDRIKALAQESQRNPDQMLIWLVLLGLQVYERSQARLEGDIAEVVDSQPTASPGQIPAS